MRNHAIVVVVVVLLLLCYGHSSVRAGWTLDGAPVCDYSGDQEYPVYFHPQVRRVLANGVRWAAPVGGVRRAPEVSNPQPV